MRERCKNCNCLLTKFEARKLIDGMILTCNKKKIMKKSIFLFVRTLRICHNQSIVFCAIT